ncbi:30078_t:CDS:2, partial [Racocetra persica]
ALGYKIDEKNQLVSIEGEDLLDFFFIKTYIKDGSMTNCARIGLSVVMLNPNE